ILDGVWWEPNSFVSVAKAIPHLTHLSLRTCDVRFVSSLESWVSLHVVVDPAGRLTGFEALATHKLESLRIKQADYMPRDTLDLFLRAAAAMPRLRDLELRQLNCSFCPDVRLGPKFANLRRLVWPMTSPLRPNDYKTEE